jgi:hypothetical protein
MRINITINKVRVIGNPCVNNIRRILTIAEKPNSILIFFARKVKKNSIGNAMVKNKTPIENPDKNPIKFNIEKNANSENSKDSLLAL